MPTRWLKASAGRVPRQSGRQAGTVGSQGGGCRVEVQDCIEEKKEIINPVDPGRTWHLSAPGSGIARRVALLLISISKY